VKHLTIGTYNLQFSQHVNKIIANIAHMAEMGVTLFCLQEVVADSQESGMVQRLLKTLGSDWQAVCHLGEEHSIAGMGNCLLWNTQKLTLLKQENVLLPRAKALAFHEQLFSILAGGLMVPYQRRTIIGDFTYNNQLLRVTNLHLDHNGGLKNRQKQLLYIQNVLEKKKAADIEIICGDFNSFDLLKRGQEAMMLTKILGSSFVDISRESGWTADLYNLDTSQGFKLFKFLIKSFNLHVRRKLDYIWTVLITIH
jgi:endonuclease/exonuclease/phosphatase family metal-dependent hydrolase